jgi:hypothetical protein
MKPFNNLPICVTTENETGSMMRNLACNEFPNSVIVEIPIYYQGRRRLAYSSEAVFGMLSPFMSRVQDVFIRESKEDHQHAWSFDMFVMHIVIHKCEKEGFSRRGIYTPIPQKEWDILEAYIRSTFLPPLESLRQYVTAFESYAELFIARALYAVALDHFYARETDEDPKNELYNTPASMNSFFAFSGHLLDRHFLYREERNRRSSIELEESLERIKVDSEIFHKQK